MALEAPVYSSITSAAFAAIASEDCSAPNHSDVADRKLGLFKRTGLFGEDLKGCTIERACCAEDLRQAYRLVHDVFLRRGFIDPDPTQMRVRIYETTPETATFVAKVENRVVAVLSVVEDSRELGLPSDCSFKKELDALRRSGRRLCEFTNQVVVEEFRKSAVPTELMRCAGAMSLTSGFHEAFAAVSPAHNSFYQLLGFRQIGSQRSYSKTTEDPVVGLCMDIDQYRTRPNGLSAAAQFIREFLTDGNHFVSQVSAWADEARRHFLDAEVLRELFVAERNFLSRFARAELQVLHERWGHEIFSAVMGGELTFTSEGEESSSFAENAYEPELSFSENT